MKPSVILYKTLPDDLQQRLEQRFTVTQVKNLRPETVSQHADAFAEAVGLLGSSEKSIPRYWRKCPSFVRPRPSPSAMTTSTSMR